MGNFIEKIKKNQFLYQSIRYCYDSCRFLTADFQLIKLKKQKNTDTKKIVFFSQMSNLWINLEDIYNTLLNNNRFDVYILMIPEFNYSKIDFNEETMKMDIYSFHSKKKSRNTIEAYKNGRWFDLKEFEPDYVFYERPYSSYLPDQYKIKNVSSYAKTCYLPYGYEMMNYIFDTSLNVGFFRYLYLFFADSHVTEDYNKKRSRISHLLKIRRTELTGHPIFNNFLLSETKDNIYWQKNDQSFKIVWAPRWTIDVQLGGSNFLEYKDKIVNYVLNTDNTSLVFRPHPLTFQNFISLGLISKEDVEKYMNIYNHCDNLYYDSQAEYFTTFWHSDVFVGDISSIIPCYFLTGKPIIYCHTGSKDDNDIMKRIFSVSYHAYCFQDVRKILDDLKSGIDPLKEKRMKVKEQLFNDQMTKNVVKNIMTILEND